MKARLFAIVTIFVILVTMTTVFIARPNSGLGVKSIQQASTISAVYRLFGPPEIVWYANGYSVHIYSRFEVWSDQTGAVIDVSPRNR